MDRYLSIHARQQPDSIAVDDDSRRLTYKDLEAEVDKLTSALKGFQLNPEEPICILEEINSKLVIAQLAVIRAGLTCVPMGLSLPKLRVIDMLNDIRAKYVLSDRKNVTDGTKFTLIPISGHDSPDYKSDTQEDGLVNGVSQNKESHEYRSHILFTSGSSGKPKAVQIPERAVLHLVTNTPITPLRDSDRVALINSPGFDVSVCEVFSALIAGAAMVPVPHIVVTDPFMFREFIAERKVSIIFLTAALLSIIGHTCPDAFRGVRHLLSAGDVPSAAALQKIYKSPWAPEHLWNTYGPTETTTYSTVHEVDSEEFQYWSIAIGKPVGDTELRLVDEGLNVIVKPGQVGEILLGGPGLTLGYINRPEENQKRFVILDGIRYYRSGDLAMWREATPDVLEFLGRADLQVKQGGFRVELGEIEQTLMASGWLSGAIVRQIIPRDEEEDPFLVAFIVPAVADTISARKLSEYLQQRLPSYMVPKDYVFCSEFPLTEHGKVDRRALEQQYWKRREKQRLTDGHLANGPSNDTASTVKQLWSSLLHKDTFNDNDDFFALGGTSLKSAALIGKLREQLGKTISMRSLHENPCFADLVKYLDEYAEGGDAPDEAEKWIEDSKLADSLFAAPDWQAGDEGRIFVSGVTGFVGVNFLSRFLQMPTVKEIVCIARAKNGVEARDRVQATLERYDLWDASAPYMHKMRVLHGDISDDLLGLPPAQYDWLANWASAVFHLAAKVNFCEPYKAHYGSNTLGTKNMINLAASGRRKSFHHMSSIDAWGPTGLVFGTRKCLEDEPLEKHVRGLPFDIGYAQSKWVSEQMVRRARECGLPTAIYRPGFIIGNSCTGAGNPDDFFARLMVGSIRLGAFPILPKQRMEYVTIDYVVNATLHIASRNQNLGKSYSLVSPDPKDSVNLERTVEVISGAGYPLKHIPYRDWVRMLQMSTDMDNPLLPVMPLLQEPVLNGLSRFETSRNTPHYDSSNTVGALKDMPHIQYVPFDSRMLRMFLEFWHRKGFYEMPGI
ncbi:linear gramicidin synthase subunit D [Aspergillus lentulus]|uniref:Linear gramicidin synthase subunit D n=1 Tax=Aspergillus lentulus TaxID=293939 RepID=A0ABQ0ZXY1_ASPLE|nr:linear gramicidin synthase subunit D [Aspergillus lentulus]GFF79598.1 linear gramicidin synthase subunit D [Aspergillus lentulus]GFF94861.1 linear gramicidin synthase subunit D [Aspergillus lentulus]